MKKTIVALYFLVVGFSSAGFAEEVGIDVGAAGPVYAFSTYSQAAQAQIEYIRAVGEARLLHAEALLKEAQAAGQFERVRQLIEYGKRLKLDLKRLRTEENKTLRFIEQIKSSADTLKVLRMGRTNQYVWGALRWFLIKVEMPTINDTLSMPIPEEAKGPENFIVNVVGESMDAKPLFVGTDVGHLLNYLEENDLSMKFLRPAHRVILDAVANLVAPAHETVTTLRQYMDDIRDKHFDIWTAPWVGVFPGDFSGIRNNFPGGAVPAAIQN